MSSEGGTGAAPNAVRAAALHSPANGTSQSAKSTTTFLSGLGLPRQLYDIACARSGDKGTSANVGVIARHGDWWEFLRTWLSAERVADFFSSLGIESVERFELPNIAALNFVIHAALRQSLRTDAQGK